MFCLFGSILLFLLSLWSFHVFFIFEIFCHCNVSCDSGSFNINYYDLGLVEEHSHEQESKTFTRDNNIYHGLANSLPMSMSNANQKYPISTIWIRMTLSKPHNAHNSHKQHLQISPTYSKPLLLQTQTHNSKVPIHPKTLWYSQNK